MRRKKIISVLLIVCVLLTSVMPVYASSDSKQINKVINTFMKGAKKSNLKIMKNCFKNPDDFNESTKFSTSGSYKFRKNIFKKNKSITYKILSTKVKGNTATVKVRMRTPTVKNAAKSAMKRYIIWGLQQLYVDEDEAGEKLLSYLNSEIKKKGVQMYTHKVTFSLEKGTSGWKISKATDTISDIPQGRAYTSLKEALAAMF